MSRRVGLFLVFVILFSLILSVGIVHAKSDQVRIALIIPSTIDDMAWSQTMYDGIIELQQEMGKDKLELDVSEGLWNVVDAGSAIRQYAVLGFDIVIAHGTQYQSVLADIAPDFPETSFAYGTGFQAAEDNIFAYDVQAQEGGYLLGMIAGKLTKTGIIGIVGPVESGEAIKYNSGFKQVVLAVNPDVKVRIAYTGSFGDSVAAGEIANTHMDAGADFLTGSAQQAVGAIRAIAERAGKYWLSTDLDQSSLAPDSILAAQKYNFKNVISYMIESREKGVLGGEYIDFSFPNKNLSLI